ncbi:hypothetical protein EMCRGX_G012467 [Ephydatia muelleri]
MQKAVALDIVGMIAFALSLLCLASASEALQCACSSPLCYNGQCTAVSGGYCYKRVIMDGGNVLSVSHGCFVPDDYYLCNSSSVVHMTTCCTAYDACNNNIPLPPKATSTVSSSNLPGIRGPPLTCLQSNGSNTTAGRCTVLSGYCYLLATTANNTIQYEQGYQCNGLPQTADTGTAPDTPVLYSCYCTTPDCNKVCVSTVGCYVDNTTGIQGCISSQRPCPAPNRTCCSGQWCNNLDQAAPSGPSPPRNTTVNNATANTPSTTPRSIQNSLRGGAGPVVSDSELVHSKPFQGLVAMVVVLGCATIFSLVAYIYIKRRRSMKRSDPQLQQFIETSV